MANSTKNTKKSTQTPKKAQPKVLIVVPKPSNVVGDTETVVSVNGEMYQIMYDRPIEVPQNVADVIESSQCLKDEIAILTESALLTPGKKAIADL